ncbi:MAG TPA: glycoside hydrolase family 127 protein [Gemmatimonadales bacterium]|jgi:hypothetical protein
MTSRRTFISTTTAALAATPILPRALRAQRRRTAPALVAHPFDLHDVTLLPGIFRDDVEVNRRFLMGLDPDRLLVSFRTTANLPTTAEPYYGWEAPNNELRGHFVGHYLSGCALMAAQLHDDAVKVRGNLVVAELAKCQQPSGYLSAFPADYIDRLKEHKGVWAPFYTLHKIMAGMLDSYSLSGNQQALDVLTGMARWTRDWVAPVDDAAMQRILNTEFGGMAETLYSLSAVTGDSTWFDVGSRFEHARIMTPLADGRDELTRVHANTTIPKIIGEARRYELTGDQRSHDIANYFWHEVTGKRSFVTGGSSSGENYKSPVGQLSTELAWDTEESCVTYNMLKLSRQLFSWTGDSQVADYYERALFNGMLGTQHPADGEKIYYTPLLPGYWRMFGTPEHGFWCCHGSGVESHSKFGDSIYFHDDRALYVNLFIASSVDWRDKGVQVTQSTSFPAHADTTLTVATSKPQAFALKLRIPPWAHGATVSINGKRWSGSTAPGSYAVIDRTWQGGDSITLTLPMELRIEAMPDDPTLQAVMYGPLVLAGTLGQEVERAAPTMPRMSPDFTDAQVAARDAVANPSIIAPHPDVHSWVRQTGPLTFTTVGQAHATQLVPFNGLIDERYVVYWKVG